MQRATHLPPPTLDGRGSAQADSDLRRLAIVQNFIPLSTIQE